MARWSSGQVYSLAADVSEYAGLEVEGGGPGVFVRTSNRVVQSRSPATRRRPWRRPGEDSPAQETAVLRDVRGNGSGATVAHGRAVRRWRRCLQARAGRRRAAAASAGSACPDRQPLPTSACTSAASTPTQGFAVVPISPGPGRPRRQRLAVGPIDAIEGMMRGWGPFTHLVV